MQPSRASGDVAPRKKQGVLLPPLTLPVPPLLLLLPLLLPLSYACAPATSGKPGLPNPRRAYRAALADFGVAGPALARDWVAAGERALLRPTPIPASFEETLFLPGHPPPAIGYLVELRRGQSLRVRVESPAPANGAMFLELFELRGAATPALVALAMADARALRFLASRAGVYVLRVQPPALQGGLYRVLIGDAAVRAPVAALTFPVTGRDTRAIGSWFGDPRDGGRRAHHGVDIFAARGTPVLAGADGVVRRVRRTRRGGNVIWLECDGSDLWLYYAHLDAQLVRPGEQVRAGDVIGRVGNTGNARSTPPHLHFGVYRYGDIPIDPLGLLRARAASPRVARSELPTGALGRWTTPMPTGALLRASPAPGAEVLAELPGSAELRIVGVSDGWYRVATADGRRGFVPAGHIAGGYGAAAEH